MKEQIEQLRKLYAVAQQEIVALEQRVATLEGVLRLADDIARKQEEYVAAHDYKPPTKH